MQTTEEILIEHAVAAYVGLAIGDALGATVEFMTPREIIYQYGQHKEIIGGGWLKLPVGNITDDTQMSLALGQSIINTKSISAQSIAEAFDEWMKTNPPDIGLTVRRGLLRYRKTQQPIDLNEDSQSAGNGACMRLLPIALATFGQTPEIIKHANFQHAHITHPNALSDAACYMVIQLIHLGLKGEKKLEDLQRVVDEWLQTYPQFEYRKKVFQNPSAFIVETLQAVFQSFFNTTSFEECLIDIVNRGGDADTTGAIAGMIAGAFYGKNAIPIRWLEKLNPDIYQQCEKQAMEIIQLNRHQQIVF
jgi:ADP-ribosyl-[dinitrogen reductase] hydrolase